jgi:hypothetical protein
MVLPHEKLDIAEIKGSGTASLRGRAELCEAEMNSITT